jgi:alpha-glucosidase (family GH31 glycosyl hydrolase)
MYEKMAKVLRHDTTKRTPILFDPTSPEFMHASLTVLHRSLEDKGCDFWWIDWQQGSYSRIAGFDPLWLLNHFHYLDNVQQKGPADGMIFSRYAGPGSHRYPVGFSGDTVSTWASLVFQPEFTATASNIGYGWWSHDIGGHIRGYRDDECTVRWVQSGVWSPLMRLHSTRNRWMSKEPWLYRTECDVAIREVMQLRHRLVPYIFSTTAADDLPLVQPLYWSYPQAPAAYRYPTQYYFGSQLVVSPVLSPRDKRTNLARTRVWIPPRRHVDIFTGTVYDGEQEIDLFRDLKQTPVLAAEGSIIPLDQDAVPANGCRNPKAVELLVVVGQDGQFEFVENSHDDADAKASTNKQRVTTFKYEQSAGLLTFTGASKDWTLRFVSFGAKPSSIKIEVDKVATQDTQISTRSNGFVQETIVYIPATPKADDMVEIELGVNPQLNIIDHTDAIHALVLDFQMDFPAKDRIWEIVQAKQTSSTKVARLLALGLEELLIGPILELLLADSR